MLLIPGNHFYAVHGTDICAEPAAKAAVSIDLELSFDELAGSEITDIGA